MNFRTVNTIVRKELLETLRDKRTLIAMIGIPVILYPALIILFGQVALVMESKIEKKESKVAVITEQIEVNEDKSGLIGIEQAAEPVADWIAKIEKVQIVETEDPNGQLSVGKLDAVVVVPPGLEKILARNDTARIILRYDQTEEDSRKARERLRDGLRNESTRLLEERLEAKGLEEEFARPLNITDQNVAPAEKTTGSILGRFLPMILIIMLGVGAFYPAIDLTAGEKERGTFETLLSTPTSKMEVVCGKFLTVLCISLFTAFLNLASMVVSVLFMLSEVTGGTEKGPEGLNLSLAQLSGGNIAMIFFILIPLAFFICAVMMSIALFARSFKEAQNYVSPFYIAIMLPGMLAGMPGMELTPSSMFIPIANVALLVKDLLIGKCAVEMIFGVFLSTSVYALLGLVVATWLFQREDVVLSEEKGFSLTLRRSEFMPRTYPTIGLSLVLFTFMLLLLFYLGSYVQERNIIGGLFITEWGILLLPTILILWFVRVDLKASLSLKKPTWPSMLGVVLMAGGMFILVLQIFVWQNQVIPIPESFSEKLNKLFEAQQDSLQNLWFLLLAFAVSPAICEEVLFRGAILAGVQSRMSKAGTVISVGILFGLFHLSVYRVLPTALLGMVITYVVIRSGSIFTGMLFHFLHNSATLLIESKHLPQQIQQYIQNINLEQKGFPVEVLLLGLLGLTAGIVIMEITNKRRKAATKYNDG